MNEHVYIVFFRPRELAPRAVIAANAEVIEENLILTDADGRLAAQFLVDQVASWSVVPCWPQCAGDIQGL